MNKIQIKITAPVGGGKTTISEIVENALREYGFTVVNDDPDTKTVNTPIGARAAALNQKYSVDIVTVPAVRSQW